MTMWKMTSSWGKSWGNEFEDNFVEDDSESTLTDLPELRPARLLLAEDDDDLRRSIAGQLRKKGYEVDEAFSGFEAIALIARHNDPYDLIISDLQLRGMNGLEIVDELRASPRQEDTEVPVILLGDQPSGETVELVERLHAVFVEKPCDLEQLWLQAEQLARPVQVDHRPS